MTTPNGGRHGIPARLLRHYFVLTCSQPSDSAVGSMFGSMLRARLSLGDDGASAPTLLSAVTAFIIKTTLHLWSWARSTLLPTPTKFHYSFSLVDLSRVFNGIMRVPLSMLMSETTLAQV
jgi:dynein heavy chain